MIIASIGDVEPVTELGGRLHPLNPTLKSARMRMVHGRFAPGEGLKLHLHERTEELYFVISGSCRVRNGDEVVELHTGSSTRIVPGTPHGLYNSSQSDCELIFVLAPTDQDMVVLKETISPL